MKGKTIKKWIAGMMLPVTTLGAFAGVIAVDSAINTTQVSAVNDETELVYESTFSVNQKEYMGVMSYNINKSFNTKADTLYKIKIVADGNRTISNGNGDDFNSSSNIIEYYYITTSSNASYHIGAITASGSETLNGNVYVYKVSNYSNINVYYFVNNINARQSDYVIDNGTMKFMKIRIEDGLFANTYTIQNLSEVINNTFNNIMTNTDYESGDFIAIGRESALIEYANTIKGRDAFDPIAPFNVAVVNGYYGEIKNNIRITKLRTIDEKAPVLETQVFLTDVDNPMSLEYILSQVEFRDEVDGVLTPVVVKDNYSSNKNTVGKYTIEVKATDKAGNTGTGNIEVWVQDKTSPIITGKSTFTSNMSSPLTEAAIRSQLSANDNVDGNISNKIQVVTDGFTGNENKKGTYTIKYKVVDTAGNESAVYTVTVSAVDDVKPVISIKEGYSDTYTSSYKNTISLETIKASLVATDNVDGEIAFEIIEDKYSGSSSIPGTYTISFRSTDSAGNISEVKVITITVTDEIPPVFYASGLFIGVSQAQTLSQQDIVNLLLHMQGLQNEGVSVRMESNEYMVDGINEPGVYRMSYRLVRPSGEVSEVQTAEIKVLGEKEVVENDEITQVTQRADNFGTKIVTALKNVGEFFIKLFKSIAWVFTFGHVDPKWNEWY